MKIFQIPVFQDNYIYVLRNANKTAVVDPALSEPVNALLEKNKWNLDYILNTHHHPDHVGGNLALKKQWNCRIIGFAEDAHRIPGIDCRLNEGEQWSFHPLIAEVLFLPGHTLGHIAYWFPQRKVLFCGDTLFGMGCGRLFEGTPEQMFQSLKKIKALPENTSIYSAHEYTEKNGRFALQEDPANAELKARMKKVQAARQKGLATIPFTLKEELQTNPFLRAENVTDFARLRAKRDVF